MRAWIKPLIATAGGLLLSLSARAQTVTGVVRDQAPIAGVTIQAELDGHALQAVSSGNDGRFSLQLSGARATGDLLLSFTKSGFRQENRILKVGDAPPKPLDIVLLPVVGSGAVTDAERRMLDPHRSLDGIGPLMFVPYSLAGGTAVEHPDDLNLRLRFQLQRLILTHVQSTLPDVDTSGLTLTSADVNAAADLGRLRVFGEYVNALAVVSGLGIVGGTGTAETIEFSSSFVVIPRTAAFVPPVLTITDLVLAASIGRVSLDQKMSREWGRATVIAMAIRDLKGAESLPPTQKTAALQRIKRYLIAERANLGANEALSAAKLKELLDLVSRGAAP